MYTHITVSVKPSVLCRITNWSGAGSVNTGTAALSPSGVFRSLASVFVSRATCQPIFWGSQGRRVFAALRSSQGEDLRGVGVSVIHHGQSPLETSGPSPPPICISPSISFRWRGFGTNFFRGRQACNKLTAALCPHHPQEGTRSCATHCTPPPPLCADPLLEVSKEDLKRNALIWKLNKTRHSRCL